MPKARAAEWEKIRNEYVAGDTTLPAIAEKYNLSLSTVRKHCAAEKWNQKRNEAREKQAKIVQDKLCEKKAKQVVRDIDKVVRVANKLLQKINRAANEIDKDEYVKTKQQHIESSVNDEDSNAVSDTLTKTHYEFERRKTLIDTKKLNNLTKSLVDVKEILTSLQGESEVEESGVLVIPALPDTLDPPPEMSEDVTCE